MFGLHWIYVSCSMRRGMVISGWQWIIKLITKHILHFSGLFQFYNTTFLIIISKCMYYL